MHTSYYKLIIAWRGRIKRAQKVYMPTGSEFQKMQTLLVNLNFHIPITHICNVCELLQENTKA